MVLADRLSRFPSRNENLLIELHHNIHPVTFTQDKINIICSSTERDPILHTVYCLYPLNYMKECCMICHKGIEKMQHLAQDIIYWQDMDVDITEYVKNCKICTKPKAMQAIQPMIPKDIPEGPWQDLAADFFHHNNSDYLLIAHTFCKYHFLYKVSSKAAEPVTLKLKSLISQYGPPRRLQQIMALHFLQRHLPTSCSKNTLSTLHHHLTTPNPTDL